MNQRSWIPSRNWRGVVSVAKKTATPQSEYIQAWHDYVEREPDKHGKKIKQLKKLVERLLKSKTVWYDPGDVEAFIDFCKLVKHREGRWAGEPLTLSIDVGERAKQR